MMFATYGKQKKNLFVSVITNKDKDVYIRPPNPIVGGSHLLLLLFICYIPCHCFVIK